MMKTVLQDPANRICATNEWQAADPGSLCEKQYPSKAKFEQKQISNPSQ